MRFRDQPLSKFLMDAIRYGDDPARRAELDRVVDDQVGKGTEDLLRERALARESLTPHELNELRRQMDEARARRLQPYYIELFFRDAFKRLGGRMTRYQVERARGPQRLVYSSWPCALGSQHLSSSW
jgi:hypothetical protein